MNCRNCGAPVKDGAKFCTGCGQTINEPASAPATSAGVYSQPAPVNPFQMNQQPNPHNQQGYGGYVQNQPNPHNSQRYGGYAHQQGGYGGYDAGYPAARGTSSGIKTILILFMAAAMIFSSLGLLFFPFAKTADDDIHFTETNRDVLSSFMNGLEANDGDIAETLEEMFDNENSLMVIIGFIALVVLLGVTVLFCIIGLVCGLAGSHSAAAAIMGIGSLITAVGYLLVFIEGVYVASESEDSILEYSVSLAPLIMIFVSVAMFILACVSAGKMRET